VIARAAALAALLCAAVPAAAQPAVTKTELRHQEPAITDAQLRDQLWGLFRKEDRRREVPPQQALDAVSLVTTPYPVGVVPGVPGVSGLCRVDVVALKLAPVQGLRRDADASTPMRAYGVETGRRFLVLPLSPEQRGDTFDDKWHGPCAQLAQDDPRFFRARDEIAAREGYALLGRAVAAAKAGELVPGCDGSQCAEAVGAFVRRKLEWIIDCSAAAKAPCYKFVRDDDAELTVIHSAGRPINATLTRRIVLRHPRSD
jgi:hypothetical protein